MHYEIGYSHLAMRSGKRNGENWRNEKILYTVYRNTFHVKFPELNQNYILCYVMLCTKVLQDGRISSL